MNEVAAQDGRARRRAFAGAAREEARQSRTASGLDARRALQFGLAGLWLLDGVLQYQPAMYTKAFGWMLSGAA